MSNKTIIPILLNRLCTGCGTCVSLCPENAINMILNEKTGVYIPNLDKDKCKECSICYQVCPGRGVNHEELNFDVFEKYPEDSLIGNYVNFYCGYSENTNIRNNSASGGMVTSLLIFALEKKIIDGALVTRMNKYNPFEPEPFIARTKEEIIEASKSKYCPVPLNRALDKILFSKKGEKFAVVGLPCHIQGIRNAERINKKLKEKIVLHFGIVCNHTPSFLATEFILYKAKIKKNDVQKLEYRSNGWPGGMSITKKNGNIVFLPYSSLSYWGLIFNNFFTPIRCLSCDDKLCQYSDVSFADAWVPEIMKRDNSGTSIIISRNNDFELLLNIANREGAVKIKRIDNDIIYKSQSLKSVYRKLHTRKEVMKTLGVKVAETGQNMETNIDTK